MNQPLQKTIVFTGGGSGGHVYPLQPLIEHYSQNYHIVYVGSKDGIEKEIVSTWNVEYKGISSGRLRRYFTLENFLDIGRVLVGIFQAIYVLDRAKPVFVFSKGGFVSVPVVVAAKLLGIPVYIHEADMTPGLANKIGGLFARHMFLSFEPKKEISKKYTVSGLPLRKEIYTASPERGKSFLGTTNSLPILLVMGGSLGAERLNRILRKNIQKLTETFTIVHLTGKDKIDTGVVAPGYIQMEYVGAEIFDVISASDIVLSRAGAGAVFEILTLGKPSVLVPLTLGQSRGDQIENANYFAGKEVCQVLFEEILTDEILVTTLLSVYKDRARYLENIHKLSLPKADQTIIEVIDKDLGTV